MTLEQKIDELQQMVTEQSQLLKALLEREMVKEFYTVDQFANLVSKAPFTVREWARLGRVRGEKRKSGRGAHSEWVFAHGEYVRYQRDGLLPLRCHS